MSRAFWRTNPSSRAVCLYSALLVIAIVAPGCKKPVQVQPQVIEDAQLGARVKTALVNDAQLGARIIEVRVRGGVVTLSGLVGSSNESARAVDIVRALSGVTEVRSQLVIRELRESGPVPDAVDPIEPIPQPRTEPSSSHRRLFAIGASVNARRPSDGNLESAPSVGPLVRLGAGRGLGLTFGFSWFKADVFQGPSRNAQGRITIRPVMGGASYTLTDTARWAASLSLVGGISFNSFTLEESPFRDGLALEVDNSLAVRPGVSLWVDLNSRAAFNVFAGYVMTRPQVTFLERDEFTKRALRADTGVFSVGVAYKVF